MSLVEKDNQTKTNLEIHPVAGRIGAEINGVHLSADLDPSTFDAIKQALLKYKVIFFRGQDHLDDKSQEAFAQLFGKLDAHPTVPTKQSTDYIHELDSSHGGGRANSWHTDVTFIDRYPKISILRAVTVPPFGGDTVWANTAAAYQDLSPELRDLADRLWALHTNEYDYLGSHTQASSHAVKHFNEVFTSTVFETQHPIVQVHPETGERTLILGHFVKKILGLSSTDSFHLFSVLQNHIINLENTVRWRWKAGDIVIWDNRATQHYAINDYGDQHRVVRRVTIEGDVPISIDGQRSTTVKGK
jgi:taurine dioxygenase